MRLFPRFVREILPTKVDEIAVIVDIFSYSHFFFKSYTHIKSQVSASFFSALTAKFPLPLEVEFRERYVMLRNATFIFQNGTDKRCVIAAKNYIRMNMSERISRKSRVNDSVCSARMCNKIELAIDPGETSGNYRRGRKKTSGSDEIFIRWRDRYVGSKR